MSSLLFAQSFGGLPMIAGIIVIAVVLVFFGLVLLLAKQYKRCPSNRVLVIYGRAGRKDQAAKTIHGGAAFVIPLVQDYAYLSLEPIRPSCSKPPFGCSDCQ